MRSAVVIRLFGLAAAVLLLDSCAVTPQRVPGINPEQAWAARQQRLAQVQGWNLSGRIVLFTQDSAWTATVTWRQRPGEYDLRLSGPLGQGTAELHGGRDGAVMRTSDGGIYFAPDASRLIYQQFGWRVPVDELRFWVLGAPDPAAPVHEQLDGYGRLARLQQSGWDIKFLGYTQVCALDLPDKIFLSDRRFHVRLAIDHWVLEQPAFCGARQAAGTHVAEPTQVPAAGRGQPAARR